MKKKKKVTKLKWRGTVNECVVPWYGGGSAGVCPTLHNHSLLSGLGGDVISVGGGSGIGLRGFAGLWTRGGL